MKTLPTKHPTEILRERLKQVEGSLAETEKNLRQASNIYLGLKAEQTQITQALGLLECESPRQTASAENWLG